jgi:hypothetical protein
MSTPPTPVTTSNTRSITPSVSAGARSARKNAASARTTNGTRSQIVWRITNGSFRSRVSV